MAASSRLGPIELELFGGKRNPASTGTKRGTRRIPIGRRGKRGTGGGRKWRARAKEMTEEGSGTD